MDSTCWYRAFEIHDETIATMYHTLVSSIYLHLYTSSLCIVRGLPHDLHAQRRISKATHLLGWGILLIGVRFVCAERRSEDRWFRSKRGKGGQGAETRRNLNFPRGVRRRPGKPAPWLPLTKGPNQCDVLHIVRCTYCAVAILLQLFYLIEVWKHATYTIWRPFLQTVQQAQSCAHMST